MDSLQFSGKLAGLLRAATEGLCAWLSEALPKLDHVWWSSLVLSQLSYQQRERVELETVKFAPDTLSRSVVFGTLVVEGE